ncbi:hypothetical protein D3C72_1979220 [compost metagenome]
MIQTIRHQAGDLVGQAEGQRVAVLEARRVVQGAQLAGDRLLDLRAVVAGAAGPQAGQAVEDAATLVVDEVVAVGAHDDARVTLERAVGRERHPLGIEIQIADGKLVVAVVHDVAPVSAVLVT